MAESKVTNLEILTEARLKRAYQEGLNRQEIDPAIMADMEKLTTDDPKTTVFTKLELTNS